MDKTAITKVKQEPYSDRYAGILMHITCLPSRFGIGDMGPEARKFADFLHRSKQSYWQILPLNPTGPEQFYSPYSSTSALAGNTLLISPEDLVTEGFLSESDLKQYQVKTGVKANFREAFDLRNILFDEAYQNFLEKKPPKLMKEYKSFSKKENSWLQDFAMYNVLKQHFADEPWYKWDEEYRLRQSNTLQTFAKENATKIEKEKWLQFIFFRQWEALRSYCNKQGIAVLGDIPFYISYDSADVWANKEIFSLNSSGEVEKVAGVPPDYFNEDGQLWGMPVFKWTEIKKRNYDWWIQRIRKNIELYDVARIDHFRAFSEFWEVPASEKTAINGEWKKGPGAAFFQAMKKEFHDLPFVAEDLGDISEDVYKLRDKFNLPGMKVIQFAFGDSLSKSDHIPHNYTQNFFAYTGTHDNNTIVGWYKGDISDTERKQITAYTGKEVNEKNVHQVLAVEVYSSVAKVAVLPIQDVLGLDEKSRMNVPASTKGNWNWRMKKGLLTKAQEKKLSEMTVLYNRANFLHL